MEEKKLTAAEFRNTPIVGAHEGVREIEHSQELVSMVKGIGEIVGMLRIGGSKRKVDFLGCSSPYVIEKVKLAIRDLQWIERRIKEMENDGEIN
jgi:hypothetical protein